MKKTLHVSHLGLNVFFFLRAKENKINPALKLMSAVFMLLFFSANSFGQLLTEDFNYTATTLLTANGWTAHSSGGTNPITVTTPSLTYTGYVGSGTGNAVTLSTSGEDDNKSLSSSQSSGSVYFACMVKVNSSQTAGDYFIHFIQGTSNFYGRVFVKKDATTTNFAFGINRGSATPVNYTGFTYTPGTTYLIVVKYTFVTGATNDVADLFINPVINGTEPSPTISNTDVTSADAASIAGIALRQGSASNAPAVVVDGIRVGNTWISVVPALSSPSLSPSVSSLSFPLTNVGSGSVSQNFTLSGSNLTGAPGNITVSASNTSYQVSNDNSNWGATTTIAYSSATLSATPVYVRFTPQGAGSKPGSITFSGGGVTSPPTVTLSGTGVGYYYSLTTGYLNQTTTWVTNPNGIDDATYPADFATDYQVFYIYNQNSPNMDAPWTVSGVSSKVVLGDGINSCALTIKKTLPFTGNIDLSANSSLILQDLTIPTIGTVNVSSTVSFEQTDSVVVSSLAYGNLNIKNGKKVLPNTTLTVYGNLIFDNVTLDAGSASPFTTILLNGNLTYNGTVTSPPTANSFTLNCNSNGTQTIFGNGNTVRLFRLQTSGTATNVVLSNSNGGSYMLLGNLTSGGLSLANGTNFTLNSNTVEFLSGGKAYFVTGTGTLSCDGTSSLILNTASTGTLGTIYFATGSNSLNNLTVNENVTGSFVLGNDLNILGTLNITSGEFKLGSSNLTIGPAASITGTFSSTAMIDATGTGQLIKTFTGPGSFTYPLGNSGASPVYSPATLTFNSGTFSSATVGINVSNVKYSNNTSVTDYLKRSWTVTQSGITGFNCDVSFQYNTADIAGTEANLYVGKYNTSWEILGQVDAVNHRLVGTGVTGFSTFTGGELASMPVNLSSFNASVQKQNVNLSWITSSETNNSGFEILRSQANSEIWNSVGFVKGSGTKNTNTNYNFSDKNLPSGKFQYRLKQIDNNGNYAYHNLGINVEVETPKKFELTQNYPNPFNPVTKIDYSIPSDAKVKMTVYDIIGREVMKPVNSEHKAGYYTVEINSNNLSSGIYFYRLTADINGRIQTLTKKMLTIK
jgi:hypothetical protein